MQVSVRPPRAGTIAFNVAWDAAGNGNPAAVPVNMAYTLPGLTTSTAGSPVGGYLPHYRRARHRLYLAARGYIQ